MTNARFRLELAGDPSCAAIFEEFTGGHSESEVVERRADERGREVVHKLPGRLHWHDITLRRGDAEGLGLWAWRRRIEDGELAAGRVAARLLMLDARGEVVARWSIRDAWPARITGPLTGARAWAIEELTIVHAGMRREA